MENDSDDEEEQHVRFLIYLATIAARHTPRKQYHVRNCIEWDEHVATLQLKSPRAFLQMYRMEISSFNKLCSWLEPFLRVDPVISGVRTGKAVITVEAAVHCLIRWLAGGSYLDV